MDFEIVVTLGTLALLAAALVSNRVGPDTAMLSSLTVLLVAGVVSPREAASGFADPALLMIASLFVVATGLTETGAMSWLAGRVLGRPASSGAAQLRLMVPVAAMSAFMNNTPIVAMYMPIVGTWAKTLRISPSKLFMPLSFAAILGGSCTLIGTSTNLVVNGMYLTYFDAQQAGSLVHELGLSRPSMPKQFWWIGVVGLPAAVCGIGFIALAAGKLLPDRIREGRIEPGGREYMVETLVGAKSPIVGQSIEQAGLRSLPGLYLVEIERAGDRLPAVAPGERIEAGDRLVFAGVVESVVDLLTTRGLEPATQEVRKVDAARRERSVVEAVVSHGSPLVRKTVREARFRTRYNAAIIAVHRNGQRIEGKIGDITLRAGDTLLLLTHSGFVGAYRNSQDFYLVSNVEGVTQVWHERAWVAFGILGLLVGLLVLPTGTIFAGISSVTGLSLPAGGVPPLAAAMLCAMLMVLSRCCTGTSARANINWQVLLVIGAALGVGKAMVGSGTADLLAGGLLWIIEPLGNHGALFVFALVTNGVCQLVTNKGAAVLMFPIAIGIAQSLGVSPEPFVVTLMASAACSFMTPIGFATNMMVLGPGGYRFTDYLRLGVPLTLMVSALCAVIPPAVFPFSG